ncbi:MAG: carbohydrate porin [Bacteroidales bacterium]
MSEFPPRDVIEAVPRILRIVIGLMLLLMVPVTGFSQDTTGFGFFGYMRSGFGVDGKGGPLDVFRAPDADAKYRLGNEAEAYVEALFRYAFEDDRKALFETNLRLAFVTPTSKSNQFTTTTSVREAYVRAKGVVQKKPSMAFWAGQRFYDRYDVHMIDYFYRDMSGFGGGFEDLQIGNKALVSFAFLGGSIDDLASNGSVHPVNEFVLNKATFDLSIYHIDVGFGAIGVNVALSNFTGDSIVTTGGSLRIRSNTGWSAGLFHEVDFEGGRNRLNIFFGKGAAENYKAVITQPAGLEMIPGVPVDVGGFSRFRILNDLEVDLGPSFSLLGLLLYQRLDDRQPGSGPLDWVSAGIRPAYHLNRYFSLVGEAGLDYTTKEGADNGMLLKVTLAPQISPLNKIMSRPALRAYFTYAHWTDTWTGEVASGSFADQNHGISVGLQMEVWW